MYHAFRITKTRYKEILELQPSRFLLEIPDSVLERPRNGKESAEDTARREADEREDVADMLRRFRENNFKM